MNRKDHFYERVFEGNETDRRVTAAGPAPASSGIAINNRIEGA